jgi:hypothetical protein
MEEERMSRTIEMIKAVRKAKKLLATEDIWVGFTTR